MGEKINGKEVQRQGMGGKSFSEKSKKSLKNFHIPSGSFPESMAFSRIVPTALMSCLPQPVPGYLTGLMCLFPILNFFTGVLPWEFC